MAIKKTELYSSLWASADELRGGMDASEYKNYVLTLLFMKYVSDKHKNDKHSMIIIPEGASFDDIVKLSGHKEIGDKMNTIIRKVADANGLGNVITTADFNSEEKLGKDKQMVDTLSKLVKIFDNLELGANTAEGDDLLGDAYEYLMRHFATESGKSKGQFYTPSEVSSILPKIIGIDKKTTQKQTVYDPTCGSGSLLLKCSNQAPNGLSIYGQEKDSATTLLCKMNLIIHNHETAEIAPGGQSTLSHPYFKEDDITLKTFDFVVANPPFSLKAWTNGVHDPDTFRRFDGYDATPPEKNGDYGFLLHIVKSMKQKAKGAVILPHGVLFRGNAEATIREHLIKVKRYIKGIIGLPANLFYGTGIPACIIVLDKEGAGGRSGIFMIDASKGFKKDGNKNRLRDQDVHKIVDTFNNQTKIKKYSRMVPYKEIEAHQYNLNIPRYIDSSKEEDIHDLYAHLNGGIPNNDIENLKEYWDTFVKLKTELFTPRKKDGYSDIKIKSNEIKSFILNHSEYKEFKDETLKLYQQWMNNHFKTLENLEVGFHPKELIYKLSEDILKVFKNVKLISKYDIYQLLMDYWVETMQDDCYMISFDGWKVGNEPRLLIPVKDKSGKNKYKEKHHFEIGKAKTRYVADLIPPHLMIAKYFQVEQKEIDELQIKLDEATSNLESFVEDDSGEDSVLDTIRNDKGNITAEALKKAIKDTKDKDDKEVFKKYKELSDAKTKANTTLNNAIKALNIKVFEKYPTLSISEIKELVIKDKWLNIIVTSIKEEIERVINSLANRIKTLEERYKTPLPKLEENTQDLSDKVEKHLKAMGITW